MGFFESTCKCCGGPAKMFQRKGLKGWNADYVCNNCTEMIPGFLKKYLDRYDYDGFVELRNYIEESNTVLAKRFVETHSYYCFHLDMNNGLMYVDQCKPRVYFKVENIDELIIIYVPDTVKEGLLSDKVKGDVTCTFKMTTPYCEIDKTLDTGVKAKANIKTGIFKDKVEYDNPKGMDEFTLAVREARERACSRLLAEMERENARYTAEVLRSLEEENS